MTSTQGHQWTDKCCMYVHTLYIQSRYTRGGMSAYLHILYVCHIMYVHAPLHASTYNMCVGTYEVRIRIRSTFCLVVRIVLGRRPLGQAQLLLLLPHLQWAASSLEPLPKVQAGTKSSAR